MSITPYLLYEDGAAAVDFLCRAFGFEEAVRSRSPEGRVWHAELRLGDGHVYLGEPGPDYRSPKKLGGATVSIHVYVDDVDAHYEAARAEGAEVEGEPEDRPYGDRVYHARDPEGHDWFFATRIREVAPADRDAEAAESSVRAQPDRTRRSGSSSSTSSRPNSTGVLPSITMR